MHVKKLDHVNIQTKRVAETLGFYAEMLGMRVGSPMGGDDFTRGGWIYDGSDAAVLHVGLQGASRMPGDREGAASPAAGAGVIHHVAFECDGHDALLARLAERGATFEQNYVAQLDLRQIFLRDPNDILVELNFRG